MVCTVCSTENPAGAAFCMGCGNALHRSCASCGADLPSGAGFCPTCGAKVGDVAAAPQPAGAPLDPSPAADDGLRRYVPPELLAKLEYAAQTGTMAGERRTITMLFCDLQGSTAAAEAMDPEEWAEVMNGAFEHLIAPVYRYEGTLARLMGDAVLAFFGAPIGHEDDPERAVRAGLEIIDAIEPYRAQVKREWGIDIDVRVGINTGLVVVGAMGSDLRVEYTAMGDAVNTAARMEQTAAPGTVQIAESTRNLVDRLFEFEDLGGIEVKGKTDPVPTYRVVKALPRPETLRGIEGLNAPLIGRDDELARLEAVIAAMGAGKGGVVSVMAEAGLGKSRLVTEAKKRVDGVRWHEGRSLSYETATPYAPVRRILRSICGLNGGEAPAEAWRKIESVVATAAPGRMGTIAPFLAWLLEVPVPENIEHRVEYLDPPQLRTEAFRATIELLESMARVEPVVIVFEDLHWADAASLDLVKELARPRRSLDLGVDPDLASPPTGGRVGATRDGRARLPPHLHPHRTDPARRRRNPRTRGKPACHRRTTRPGAGRHPRSVGRQPLLPRRDHPFDDGSRSHRPRRHEVDGHRGRGRAPGTRDDLRRPDHPARLTR